MTAFSFHDLLAKFYENPVLSGLLIANVLALVLSWRAFYLSRRSADRQADAQDVKNYIKFRDMISQSWTKFRDAKCEDREYEMTEVFSVLELISHLHCKDKIHGATKEMTKDYLCEVMPGIFESDYARKIFTKSSTEEKTYEYIRKFAKFHGIEIPE